MERVITSTADIQRVYEAQRANRFEVGKSSAKERIVKLKNLLQVFLEHKDALAEAMYADFGKPKTEVMLTEIYTVQSQIKSAIANVHDWMRDEPVGTKLALLGTSSYIRYEPKGSSLIISPWNYPADLTFGPLSSAIAAGCTAIIKPSEFTPHTSAVMRQIIEKAFPANEVAVLEGDVSVSQVLLQLKFDHIFFTGAPAIGKIVMKAAAEHLTSVTLELGGKSPTIVDETANLKLATLRILVGKYMNCGQTCIAPDYIFVHESKKDALIAEIKTQLDSFYGQTDEEKRKGDLARIVSSRNFGRIKSYIEDAVLKGARVEYGGQSEESTRYIAPTILTGVNDDMAVLQEEIFGPLLPIMTYKSLSEVTNYINKGEKPLAMYIFSGSKRNQQYLLENTSSGGVCINETLFHVANYNLPFGGVNNSGNGKSHGVFGFREFSNQRAVLKRWLPQSATDLLRPPYTDMAKKLTDIMLRWL